MKIISSIKPVLFEKLHHEDKAGNYIDQMYKDDEGRFKTYSIFTETDAIVEKIRNDVLSKIHMHKELFYRPVPKIWVERFFVHEMYWDIFWQVFLMAVLKQQNAQEKTDSDHFANRFLVMDSPSNKYLFQSKYFEDTSTIVFGRGLWRFIFLAGYLQAFLLYISFIFYCFIRVICSFRLTRRPVPNMNKIAVEYVWGHDLNMRSDLYWYQNIVLPSNRVLFYLNRPDRPLTIKLKRDLQKKGFGFVSLTDWGKKRAHNLWQPGTMKYINDIKYTTRLLFTLLNNRSHLKYISIVWCFIKGIKLVYKVNYWKSFFKDFNVKVNMSHSGDTGSVHVTQSLAMDLCDGVNVRSNYSYTSLNYLYHAREFHAYFRWGLQMGCNRDERLYNLVNIITGYPFDYLFKINNTTPINKKTKKYQKFAVTVFDTTISNDYRKKYYHGFIKMAADDHIHAIFKPKKKLELRQQEFPDVQETFEKGNLSIMAKETMPYHASKNANISVCLGINTAGIEVALDGGRCLYWVPDGYKCPQLESEAGSKLIFHDLEKLLELVKALATGKKSIDEIGDHSKFIAQIDPWRDHKAGERIGRYVKSYLDAMDKIKDSNKSLETATQSYMAQWGKDTVVKCTLE